VGSWNVNGKKNSEDLSAWICSGSSSKVCENDLYVICFQEMVDLNATNVMMDGKKVNT
jgi:hypothetical protein